MYRRKREIPIGDELKTPFGELVAAGAGKWKREQTAAEPLRGRTATSMSFPGAEVGVLVNAARPDRGNPRMIQNG